ncbi:immunoglobulin domain-containing protein [Aquimarina algicola]|uniref:Immunoglobulin domain-containing protein n=1 Tax=Aquimarina algicola TaxID=2589995 RepID=A0A504J501_9FLAO|nr:Calx-beta domain-containing protein [Aquimarina algicola]TPN81780.1 immunoglobulin domain-containing protein [Aquimarina algicola]
MKKITRVLSGFKMPVLLFLFSFFSTFGQTGITSLSASYKDINDSSNDFSNVGNGTNPGYSSATTYNLLFSTNTTIENDYTIDGSFVAGGTTYNTVILIDQFEVRRNGTIDGQSNRQILWFERESTSGTTINLRPSYVASVEESFRGFRLNIGSDNTFVNTGSNQSNNIERFDYINSSPLSTNTTANAGFAIFERDGNDSFKIAAITGLDAFGEPNAFTPLLTVNTAAYGPSLKQVNYTIFQKQDSESNLKPAENGGPQQIRGTFVSFQDLGVIPNQAVYGYVILPADATSVDFTTNPTNTDSSNGGMDAFPGGGFFDSDGGLTVVNMPDADNDGVSNTLDQDDDNDGILDINEGLDCGNGDWTAGGTYNINQNLGATINNTATYNTRDVDLTATLSGGATLSFIRIQNAVGGNGQGIVQRAQNSNFNTSPVDYTYTFNDPVVNLAFDFGGLDNNDFVEVRAFLGANEIILGPDNFSVYVASDVSYNGTSSFLATNSGAGNNSNNGSFSVEIGDPIDRIVLKTGKSTGSGQVTLHTSAFRYCIPRDTDNNGVYDHLDTDSDNDGCADAIEGGYTDPDDDEILGNSPVSVDGIGRVTGQGGYSGTRSGVITFGTLPSITAQSANQTINTGSNTSFTVTATGSDLTYRWQVDTGGGFVDIDPANTTDIYTGSDTASLNLTNVPVSDDGNLYRVIVSSTSFMCGNVESSSILLNVNNYTVNLTASVDTAVEGGIDGEFTATLNAVNTTGSAIVIPVVMSGTATDGTDYTSIVNITIPNGSDTGTVAVDAATDGLIEGDETAIASLGTLPSGVVAGTSTSDTVTISDATEYTVNLTASVDTAVEGGTDGEFTATLNAVNTTGSAIVIPVVMSGTATDGTDYTSIVNITIPNGSDTGTVAVDAATDGLIEGDETAIARWRVYSDFKCGEHYRQCYCDPCSDEWYGY